MKKLLLMTVILLSIVSCQKELLPLQPINTFKSELYCIYHIKVQNNTIVDTVIAYCLEKDSIFYWDTHEFPGSNEYRTKPTTDCNCN